MDKDTKDKALKRAARVFTEGIDGRVLFDHLKDFGFYGRELFTGGETFERIAYMLGRRSVILEIERLAKQHKEIEHE